MRLLAPSLALALLASAPASAQPAPPPPAAAETETLRAGIDTAIASVYPALVRIHVVLAYYKDGREVKGESAGSGVIISPDGYVVTNHHVAGRAKRLYCTLSDRREVGATLIGTDALSDIAVIKLDGPGPYPVARWGDASALRVGDRVLAMGSPLALSQSVTLGIVSNARMTFPDILGSSRFELDGEETGSIVRWIGHDAQIFPGNSGGPLVNLAGEVVGINEISYGLSGAIPGDLAREVAERLIAKGGVTRSWLGVDLQPLLKGDTTRKGVLVAGVLPGSPAAAAGLKPGDVLLSYAGRAVEVRHAEQMPEVNRLLLGTPIGDAVDIVYRRQGKEMKARATTVSRGQAQGDEAELKSWGIAVRELTLLAAQELKRQPGSGVLVSSVRTGAPAATAKPSLQPGDIIVQFDGKAVHTVAELIDLSAAAIAGGASKPVLVGVERRAERLLTVVRLGLNDGQDRSAEARKAWLAVAVQVLTADLAKALGLEGRTGVRLTQVYAGGPAAAGGLKVGDVLLKLDGMEIPASNPEDVELFASMIRQYRVGTKVKVDGQRDGQPLSLEVDLGTSPSSPREAREYRDLHFEFTARDLMFQDRVELQAESDPPGVLITGVESGGWAAIAHLAVQDVVLSVDGRSVSTAAEMEAIMKRVAAEQPQRVVFFVKRGVHTLFLELEPAWERRTAAVAPAAKESE